MSTIPKPILSTSQLRDVRQFIKDNLEPIDAKIAESLNIIGQLQMSGTLSAKRTADALERIAVALEQFMTTPRN